MENKKKVVTRRKTHLQSFLPLGKKAVVDKVFIYVFSVIVVGFAGLLVAKFVFTFSDDVDLRLQTEFYEKLEKDYNLVYKTYGSEKVLIYKVHSDVKFVCFIPDSSCLNNIEYIDSEVNNYDFDTINTLVNAKDNVIMFDKNDVMNSYRIGVFNSNNNCFCAKPNLGKFELIMENSRNEVFISMEN